MRSSRRTRSYAEIRPGTTAGAARIDVFQGSEPDGCALVRDFGCSPAARISFSALFLFLLCLLTAAFAKEGVLGGESERTSSALAYGGDAGSCILAAQNVIRSQEETALPVFRAVEAIDSWGENWRATRQSGR